MKSVLIDTDGGVDDALAIALALASPELVVEGITTVCGNVGVEQATSNTLLILETLSPVAHPPVAIGAAAPLNQPLETASHVHGADGVGNITDMRLPDGGPRKYPEPPGKPVGAAAVSFILDQVKRLGDNLTIITLGPLTNIALAIRNAPDIMRRVGKIVIMGGAFEVRGNVSPVSEFNIFVDPEAADIVVGFDVPKTIVPLDVTEQVRLMRPDLTARLAASPSSVLEFVRDVSAFYMDFHREHDGFDGCYLHDPTAVAVAIDPSLARAVPAMVRVECDDGMARGMTVADLHPQRLCMYQPNADLCVEIDAPRCLGMFLSRLFR